MGDWSMSWVDERWVRDVCIICRTNQIGATRFQPILEQPSLFVYRNRYSCIHLAFFSDFRCFVYYGWAKDFVDGFEKSSEFNNQLKNNYKINTIVWQTLLTWLKMTSAQVVEMTVTNNSTFQIYQYPHPDNHTMQTKERFCKLHLWWNKFLIQNHAFFCAYFVYHLLSWS